MQSVRGLGSFHLVAPLCLTSGFPNACCARRECTGFKMPVTLVTSTHIPLPGTWFVVPPLPARRLEKYVWTPGWERRGEYYILSPVHWIRDKSFSLRLFLHSYYRKLGDSPSPAARFILLRLYLGVSPECLDGKQPTVCVFWMALPSWQCLWIKMRTSRVNSPPCSILENWILENWTLEASVEVSSEALATRRGLLIPLSGEKIESVQSALEAAGTGNREPLGRRQKGDKKHSSICIQSVLMAQVFFGKARGMEFFPA